MKYRLLLRALETAFSYKIIYTICTKFLAQVSQMFPSNQDIPFGDIFGNMV